MANLSRIYKIMGKKKDAIDTAQKIIHNKPESPIGYMALAMIYRDDKEFDKAIETLRKAAALNDTNISMMLGNMSLFEKRLQISHRPISEG